LSSPHREALNQRNKKSKGKEVKKNYPEKNSPPKKYVTGDFFFETYSIFFSRVFELPLPRNAQKRTKKKGEKKEGTYVLFFLFFASCADVRRFLGGFFLSPLVTPPPPPFFLEPSSWYIYVMGLVILNTRH
jgi:hypothetical protein